jgi:hypothetical protein
MQTRLLGGGVDVALWAQAVAPERAGRAAAAVRLCVRVLPHTPAAAAGRRREAVGEADRARN